LAKKPSALQRFKQAIAYYRFGWPAIERKAPPFIWPSWRSGQPQWSIVNAAAYIAEGFEMNSVIYSAIMYKARAATVAPLRAYTGNRDDHALLPDNAPLAALCRQPNEFMAWSEFQMANTVFLNLIGNSFVYVDNKERKDRAPTSLYALRPDRVAIVPGPKNSLKGYLYAPEGAGWQDAVPILPEDMIHVRLPNPGDNLEGLGWGLSPIAPMAQSADVDNAATKFLSMFFQHGASIPGVLSFDVPMTDDTVASAKERWMEVYGGSDNWTDIAVLDQGGKYQRVGLAFNEMGFENIDSRDESRICGPFGVPPILIGTRFGLESATYSNYELARRAFWEDTMLPEMGLFETEYQSKVPIAEANAFVAFDFSDVPALRVDTPALIESVVKLFGMGVPLNTAAATVGLELADKVPGGDIGYLPLNLMPVGMPAPKPPTAPPATQAEESAPTEAETPEEAQAEESEEMAGPPPAETKGLTPDQKALLWKQQDNIARSWEPKFGDAAVRAFEQDRRHILALVGDAKGKSKARKATLNYGELLDLILAYLSGDSLDGWKKEFQLLIEAIIQDQGKMLNAAFGMEFDVRNLFSEAFFDTYIIPFVQEVASTTEETIRLMLKQGMEEGWSIDAMTDHLFKMFDYWMNDELSPEEFAWYSERMPVWRREMIARTETIGASNYGSHEIYKGWGVKRREWLSTMDDRTRGMGKNDNYDHVTPNGQVRSIDEPFDVSGEKLMYPGDKAGSAGNVINCRCTTIPVMD
jgi:HK97 family phage portal protein